MNQITVTSLVGDKQSNAQNHTYEDTRTFGNTVDTFDRSIPILMAIEQPRIILFGNVLSKEECQSVIALAKPRMAASAVLDETSAKPRLSKVRISNTAYLKPRETSLIEQIERRIADITQWPINKGEILQIQQYPTGGEYAPHFDFFPPNQLGDLELIRNGGQRIATLIVYLNNVEEGGETVFPKLNLKIKPVQGNALYFSYANSEKELNRMTLHGGNVVIKGEKWIMSKWMRREVIPISCTIQMTNNQSTTPAIKSMSNNTTGTLTLNIE